MPTIDEETECYHVRGVECCNLIPNDVLKDLLKEAESEISARPTDYETCSNCLKGSIVESLQTIIGNIPNLIPLIEIRKKDGKKDDAMASSQG